MKTNTTLLFGLFICLILSFTTQMQAQNLNVEGDATAAKFIGDGSMLTNIDKDTLNELQKLVLSGDTLMLSKDTTNIDLSVFINNWTINDGRDVVFGYNNLATGDSSSALGVLNTSTGDRSNAFGYSNQASGNFSNVIGFLNTATGIESNAFGFNNNAVGYSSSAFGHYNIATGSESNAFGRRIISDVYGLMAIGRYNADPVGSATDWVATEPVFVIGNGEDFANRSTAVTVLKNGDVGIGTQNPNVKLQITGGTNAFNSGGGYIINGEVNDLNLALDNNEIVARNNGTPSDLFIQNPGGNTILNGSNGGNVGIGTTSPNHLLDLGSSVVSQKLAVYQATDDFYGLGLSSGQLHFHAASTSMEDPQMVLTSGGNVGIGTDNPQTKLHIEGGSDTAPASGGYIVTGDITGLNISIDNNEIMARNNGGTSDLSLQNEGGNTIIASGVNGQNVGIGTTTPDTKLDIEAPNKQLRLTDSDDNKFWQMSASGGGMAFRYQEGEADEKLGMWMDVNGSVGIGTTSPTEKLEVIGNVKATKFIGDGSMLTNIDQQDLSLSGETLNLTDDVTPVNLSAFINNWTIDNRDIAFGYFNDATGFRSSAFGYINDATGERSSAFGYTNDATGFRSSAFGSVNDATGFESNAFGYTNDATGERSSAFGYTNEATGDQSSAFGYTNEASASQSSAFGYGTLSDVYGLMAVGRWNADPVGSATTWISTDPVFVIGNGENSSNRSTAVTVLRNGNLGIGTESPSQKLDVNGRVRIRNLPAGALGDKTVLVDASGNLFKSDFSPNINASDIGQLQDDIALKTQIIQDLQFQLEEVQEKNLLLEARLAKIEALLSGTVEGVSNTTSTLTSASLQQNAPNPFTEATTINYFIPENIKSASLQVLDQNGRIIKIIPIQDTGEGQITLQANLLSAGTYSYSLILDGQVMETKQMVLTH